MNNFRRLEVWELVYMLNVSVYDLTRDHRLLTRSGLAPQMQRAGTDIACNIARGCGSSDNDGAQRWHFNNAMGAAASLEYLVFLAFEMGLIPEFEHDWFTAMTADIQKRLQAMLEQKAEEKRAAPDSVTMVQ
ncbi:MAG: four helix bundle protein [Candidatus Korobacteraceae bacterium]